MGVEQQQVVLIPEEHQPEPACQHYWLIETPAGPASRGVCRLCGQERQFQNYLGSHPWEQDASPAPVGGNGDLDRN